MTIRQKISLLITAAGFMASLVFSCFILWEMTEQPLRLIDSDLESTARRAVRILSKTDKNRDTDAPLFIGDERYWLKVDDQNTGKLIYQSRLAQLIEIPELTSGSSTSVNLVIPREKFDLGQDQQDEVTFRVKKFKISIDGRTFLVMAGRPMEKIKEELGDTVVGVASGLAFSTLLLMLVSYFVAGFILKPVRIINEQARDISERHLDRRMPVTGDRDEFNALSQTLNLVFDRLQHAFLRQKRLLADASHELKTPLTMMRLSMDEMRSGIDENPSCLQAEKLSRMTEQVLRMERLVKNLLDLSALEIEGTMSKDPVDVAKMLESLITDYRLMADTRNIQIETRLPRQLLAIGNAEKLNRAFSNILDNAIKYNADDGRVDVIGDQSDADLTITIINTGPGVAEAEIHKVFDQFYRIEESRSVRYGGAGLGLAIVKRVVELHGGKVKLESKPGSWTRVTVSLPRYRKTTSS
ncbi:MAG: HAMP domain-containing sensor histidine kinase [Desulfobacterales bacterium]